MLRFQSVRAALLVLGIAGASGAVTQDEKPAETVRVPEDLAAVIALRGKPCGEVTAHERIGPDDYSVTCASGHRYRVFVDAAGRVVVEPR